MRLILKYILRGSGKILAFFMLSQKWRDFFNYQLPARIYQIFFVKNIIFLNVGADCRAALHLKAHLLRKCSAPLDWIMCYSIESAYQLYKSEFADFFSACSEDKSKTHKGKRFVVADNGMVAMHHFPANVEISAYLPTFQYMTQRRFCNLKAKIVKSKCVVLVCHRDESVKSLGDFALKMQDLFALWSKSNADSHESFSKSKRVFLVNILHKADSRDFEKQIYEVHDNVAIIQYIFDDTSADSNFWLGNKRLWGKVMGEIEILK